MILLILWSSLTGLAMREWKGCRRKTVVGLLVAIFVLVAAVLSITYGNYLAPKPAKGPA